MKIVLLTLIAIMSLNFASATNLAVFVKSESIKSACLYDKLELRAKNPYSACFDTDKECLNSPLWKFRENVTTYSLVGGFGYSCNFLIEKRSMKVVQYRFTDPGE